MPLVNNINVPPEVYDLWIKACTIRYGFYGDKVDKKNIVWRRRNFPSLIARGNYQGLSQLWASLTAQQQSDWDDAGYWSAQSGWDLFAQDTLYRISNEIAGVATPNLYHQFKVARANLATTTQEFFIKQDYYDIPNTEVSWAINIFCPLVSDGAGSYAKFIVRVVTGYWNDDIDAPDIIEYEYDLTEFNTFWDYISDSYIDGFIDTGKVFFELCIYKMTGSLYIDGVELNYNDQNFARDFQCNYVDLNWDKVQIPVGGSWSSIYPDDGLVE